MEGVIEDECYSERSAWYEETLVDAAKRSGGEQNERRRPVSRKTYRHGRPEVCTRRYTQHAIGLHLAKTLGLKFYQARLSLRPSSATPSSHILSVQQLWRDANSLEQ